MFRGEGRIEIMRGTAGVGYASLLFVYYWLNLFIWFVEDR